MLLGMIVCVSLVMSLTLPWPFAVANQQVTMGVFAATDDIYLNSATFGFDNRRQLLLEKFNLPSGEPMECMKRCVFAWRNKCGSFVINWKMKTCYINKGTRCDYPQKELMYISGVTTYELRSSDTNPGKDLCFRDCLVTTPEGCHSCGRPNCQGKKCDKCSRNCWDLQPRITGRANLWQTLKRSHMSQCQDDWQLVWEGERLNKTSYVKDMTLQLQLVIKYETSEEKKTSLFETATFGDEGMLSVGDYVGGKAGNYWGAPFADKRFLPLEPDNSGQFSNDTGADQSLDIFSKEGFKWEIGDSAYDDLAIKSIQFWVRPVDL
ncbi:uncharacterized protein LOC143036620 [Oratosquilla oratoria]|uniref:uncharacterized protein LOC143036620 n=1 Tax=Oratosquilla oratoria TaxID=337810 RepID=UPI003F76B884